MPGAQLHLGAHVGLLRVVAGEKTWEVTLIVEIESAFVAYDSLVNILKLGDVEEVLDVVKASDGTLYVSAVDITGSSETNATNEGRIIKMDLNNNKSSKRVSELYLLALGSNDQLYYTKREVNGENLLLTRNRIWKTPTNENWENDNSSDAVGTRSGNPSRACGPGPGLFRRA